MINDVPNRRATSKQWVMEACRAMRKARRDGKVGDCVDTVTKFCFALAPIPRLFVSTVTPWRS